MIDLGPPDYRDIGPELTGFAHTPGGSRLTDRLGDWLAGRAATIEALEALTDSILEDIKEAKR
jgi:hypothetical protein